MDAGENTHGDPARDAELVEHASRLLQERGVPGRHSVAAAVRATNGRIHSALDLRSRKSAICAEPSAISAAHSAGDYDLEAIVAICHYGEPSRLLAISPCGACRELLHFHQPGIRVLFEASGRLVAVSAADLFEYPTIPA
jgi:cytidine deaminase